MRDLRAASCLLLAALPASADTGLRGLADGAEMAPFRAVGRLDLDGRGFCTATLLTDRLVLTAAHCVLDGDGGTVPAHSVTFRAGLADGKTEAQRRGRRIVVADGYDPARSEFGNLSADLALVELDRPVEPARALPFPAGPAAGRRVGVVSYAQDRPDRPSIQEACEVLDRREGALILSCLADFGSSGAPILARGPSGLQVVSVVSATALSGARRVSIGSDLGALSALVARMEAGASGGDRIFQNVPLSGLEEARRTGPGHFTGP